MSPVTGISSWYFSWTSGIIIIIIVIITCISYFVVKTARCVRYPKYEHAL